MKIKKNIPLIDQHNKNGFWGGKFGGNYIPETLKKPVEDLEILFSKLRNNKNFIFERDKYFKNWVGSPTRFIKLENLTAHLDGAQIWSKVVKEDGVISGGYTEGERLIKSDSNKVLFAVSPMYEMCPTRKKAPEKSFL